MSSLKDKVQRKVSTTKSSADPDASDSSDTAPSSGPDKYKMRVTAGPSYDASTHVPVPVNASHSLAFENAHVRVQLKVRIRDYAGLPPSSQSHSPYFDDPTRAKDLYSIAFAFVPKHDLPAAPTRWGNDFDHPVAHRLPPGFNTAFNIVKQFIDPGLECDAYGEKPWLLGPSLSCWFAFRIGEKVNDGPFAGPEDEPAMREGADGDGEQIREATGMPADAGKRRKYFLSAENREKFVFEAGRVYQGDFHNPYLDFNACAVKLPGFSLGVLRFTDDKTHTLRYVFKNVENGDVYFVVVLTCLFGDELQAILDQDAESG